VRAHPGERVAVGVVEDLVPLGEQAEPVAERKPVAERGVGRAVEVDVDVHEARHDRGVAEAAALSQLGGGADGHHTALRDRDRAVLDRRAGDREHPVGREDAQRANLAFSSAVRHEQSSVGGAAATRVRTTSTIVSELRLNSRTTIACETASPSSPTISFAATS